MGKDILIIPNSSANPQIQFSGSANNSIHLEVYESGSVSFESQNSGSLFSIVDSMSGSLMAVSDISGLPILEVFSSDRVVAGQFGKETLDVDGINMYLGSNDTSGSITFRGALTGSFDSEVSRSAAAAGFSGGAGSTAFGTRTGSLQFIDAGELSASINLAYLDSSSTFELTGSMKVTGSMLVDGQVSVSIPTTKTPTVTTETIDWNDGNIQILYLGSASGDVTLTFNNPIAGSVYTLKVIQGNPPRNLTYPAAVKWEGGTPLVPSVNNNDIDLITMVYDGTNYLASYGTQYA